jgi:acetyl esterase/lipase
MPPGNDALAKHFQNAKSLLESDPKVSQDINVLRALMDGTSLLASEPIEVIYEDEPDLTFLGPSLWCTPLSARDSPNVILYLHGGGFVTNSIASHRKMAAHFGKAADFKVLMIDYRLAPEHQFPAQLDDAVESYRWLLKKGYKPGNIATMGDSAGGNLCTAVVLKLRELGEPLPRAIVPISPWYDMVAIGGTMDSNAETDALVQRDTLKNMVDAFVKPKDVKNPLAHILDADPKGLPPMYIIAGSYETLKDNATKFAEQAKGAGVEVELEIKNGQQHVYTFMAGKDKNADETIANVGKWLRGRFKA